MKQMSQASWVSIVGAVASIVAAAGSGFLAWKGATETAEINRQGAIQAAQINKAGAEEVARIQKEGAFDNQMIDWAMIIMQKLDATVPEREWALEILSIWKKVPMTPERRKQIAESRKPLSETGKLVPEAKSLNDKLDSAQFWRELSRATNWQILPMDLRPGLDGGTKFDQLPAPDGRSEDGGTAGPKFDQLPGDGKSNQLQKKN